MKSKIVYSNDRNVGNRMCKRVCANIWWLMNIFDGLLEIQNCMTRANLASSHFFCNPDHNSVRRRKQIMDTREEKNRKVCTNRSHAPIEFLLFS